MEINLRTALLSYYISCCTNVTVKDSKIRDLFNKLKLTDCKSINLLHNYTKNIQIRNVNFFSIDSNEQEETEKTSNNK